MRKAIIDEHSAAPRASRGVDSNESKGVRRTVHGAWCMVHEWQSIETKSMAFNETIALLITLTNSKNIAIKIFTRKVHWNMWAYCWKDHGTLHFI